MSKLDLSYNGINSEVIPALDNTTKILQEVLASHNFPTYEFSGAVDGCKAEVESCRTAITEFKEWLVESMEKVKNKDEVFENDVNSLKLYELRERTLKVK